ncbi:MAG: hypothetical protein ACRBCK_10020 [Alphaproteobacteria bacterium]
MIDLETYFAVPNGQSFIYSYQPLIASMIALLSAGIAYFAATYKTRIELANRNKYYDTMLDNIDIDLNILSKNFQNFQATKERILALKHLVEQYDRELFNYEFVSGFTPAKIKAANEIQFAMETLKHNLHDMYQELITNPHEWRHRIDDDIAVGHNLIREIQESIYKSLKRRSVHS